MWPESRQIDGTSPTNPRMCRSQHGYPALSRMWTVANTKWLRRLVIARDLRTRLDQVDIGCTRASVLGTLRRWTSRAA